MTRRFHQARYSLRRRSLGGILTAAGPCQGPWRPRSLGDLEWSHPSPPRIPHLIRRAQLVPRLAARRELDFSGSAIGEYASI